MKKRLFSLILAALMLFSLFPFTAAAADVVASGSCGENVTWTLDSEGLLAIRGSGPMADQNFGGCVVGTDLRDQVRSVVIADGVTYIGNFSFNYNENAETILLPNSVTAFGNNAFDGCKSLQYITLPNGLIQMGNFCFAYCYALQEIEIPEGVTTLGYSVFSNCTSLKRAAIPSTVRSVDSVVFANCRALEEIDYTGTQERWDTISDAVMNWITDSTLVHIHEPVDSGSCGENVTWMLFDNGLLNISGTGQMDNYDYYSPKYGEHKDFRRVVFEDGVTSIGEHAFDFCEALEQVTIAPSVETIGQHAFYYCTSLSELTIPDGVREIGFWAFAFSGLQSVFMADSVTTAEDGIFYACGSLKEVVLSRQLTSIGNDMFSNCESLQSVAVPDSVKTVGNQAFYACSNLENVIFGNGLQSIGEQAFYSCENIKVISLPASLSSIESTSFIGCASLERIDIDLKNPSFCSVDGVLFNHNGTELLAFPDAKAGEYEIPSGVIRIAPWAISYSRQLTRLIVPEGVTSIGAYGIYSNRALEEVVLPSTVTEISDFAFSCNSSLNSIAIPEGVTKLGEEMFAGCDKLQSIQLPSTLTELGRAAFSGCNLTSIVIPEGITTLPEFLFAWNRKLAEVTLPTSIQRIELGAFYYCGVKDVYYKGTESQWDQIHISSEPWGGSDGNSALKYAAIHFTEPALTILAQPQPVIGRVGDTATFSVEAEGDGLTYQWQYLDPGADWKDSSFTTPTMSCKLTAARSGRQYRCIVTDAYEHQVTSDAALITVVLPPVITQQPQNYTGPVGSTAVFSVEAEGEGLTYRWQYRDVGGKWTNSSFRAASMSCKLTAERDGRQYRCVITDAWKNQTTSSAATMTALPGPAITQQPQDFAGRVGTNATFAVEATGEGLTYRWQYRDVGGQWTNSSFRAASMSCKLTAERDGREYRCIVTDVWGNKVTSEAAAMTIVPPPIITQQPQDFSGPVGSYAVFTVVAEGDGLTYRWQYKDVGGEWLNSSFKTADMTCKITAARDGRLYRCVITDGYGNKITSEAAAIRVTLN